MGVAGSSTAVVPGGLTPEANRQSALPDAEGSLQSLAAQTDCGSSVTNLEIDKRALSEMETSHMCDTQEVLGEPLLELEAQPSPGEQPLSPELEVFRCSVGGLYSSGMQQDFRASDSSRRFVWRPRPVFTKASEAQCSLPSLQTHASELESPATLKVDRQWMSEVLSEGEIEMNPRRPDKLTEAVWRSSMQNFAGTVKSTS